MLVDFATSYGPNSIEGTISHLPTVQQNIGKWSLYFYRPRHFYEYRKRYNYSENQPHTYGNETSASVVLVMNQG